MEHIVYLIALQNPKDLLKISKHSEAVSQYFRKINAGAVSFAALASAEWTDDYGEFLCIGDNREDNLIFYPIDRFKKNLKGFSYLPIKSERNNSVFNEFEDFCSHEMRSGVGSANEIYHIFIVDFRMKSSVFVGNEADVIVRSLDYNFGNRSTINLLYRKENRAAYKRLEELLPGDSSCRVGIIGSGFSNSPFTYNAVAAMLEQK